MVEASSAAFTLAGKRVWVAGHRGMVGSALTRRLRSENCTLLEISRREVDLREQAAVRAWMTRERPEVVHSREWKVCKGVPAPEFRPQQLTETTPVELVSSEFRCGNHDQGAVVDDGQAADMVLDHHGERFGERSMGVDGPDRAGHNIAGEHGDFLFAGGGRWQPDGGELVRLQPFPGRALGCRDIAGLAAPGLERRRLKGAAIGEGKLPGQVVRRVHG